MIFEKIMKKIKCPYGQQSYAQEGEDILLFRYIGNNKSQGFYVDVGAHHPKRFSNTYYFYKQGWRGINIEPTPTNFELFKKERALDINLNVGVSNKEGYKTFYMFNEPALNTFSDEQKNMYQNIPSYVVQKVIEVKVQPLSYILDKYLPQNTEIDFLSIDVEGWDLEVLQSNNWTRYCPKFILIEDKGHSLRSVLNSPILSFLEERSYVAMAKTFNTLLFKYEK